MNAILDRPVHNLKTAPIHRVKSELMLIPPDLIDGLIFPDPANRVTNDDRNHINNLKKLMREFGFSKDHPIIVASSGLIKAGHHRYYAAKELGIPIYIIIDDNYRAIDITRMDNCTKKWGALDFIRKYAREGVGEYPRILAFHEKHGFGIKVTLMLLTGIATENSQATYEKNSCGKLTIEDWEKAEWKADQVRAFAPFFREEKDCRNTHFAAAILYCLKLKGYSNEEMLRKIAQQTQSLRLQKDRRSNLEMLQAIYNFGRQLANRLTFVTA